MTRALLLLLMLVCPLSLSACDWGNEAHSPEHVDLPSNHGHGLDEALQRLHAVGLRASFPVTSTPCGNGLPWVNTQSPRAPIRVKRGSVIALRFGPSAIPSPAVPIHHARWTHVPQLVGHEYADASSKLRAIWPCVHVQAATGTSGGRAVIVAQNPRAGTRVPAYGVQIAGRGYRPTTVNLTVAARE